jgi:putative membrane protein
MDWDALAGSIMSTTIWSVFGILLFGLSMLIVEKITPFSIRKEIEEDQNTALGIVIGAALIGLAIIISSVIRS